MIKLTDIVICKECNLEFSKCGIISHVRHKHSMTYLQYRKKHDLIKYNKCKKCGNITTNKFFCSVSCGNTDKSKIRRNFTEEYKTLSNDFKTEIISLYKTNIISINQIIEKYHIDYELIKMVFKEFDIKVKQNMCGQKLKEKYEEKIKQIAESEIGDKIVDEYKKTGCSLRSLAKQNRTTKDTIKRILLFRNIEIKSSIAARNEMRVIHKQLGIPHPMFGRSSKGGKTRWYFYKGIKFQGSWEFKYGLYLESKNIKFKCHVGVKRFEYQVSENSFTYCPDFYLEETNEYIDIKGFFSKIDKRKIGIVRSKYPEEKIVILKKNDLMNLGILDIDKELGINIADYEINLKDSSFIIQEFKNKVTKDEFVFEYLVKKQNFIELSKKYNTPIHILSNVFNEWNIPKLNCNKYSKTNFIKRKNFETMHNTFLIYSFMFINFRNDS